MLCVLTKNFLTKMTKDYHYKMNRKPYFVYLHVNF